MWENVRICKKWRFIGGILQRESRYHTDVRGLHGLFLGGIGEMEWYYFWEKRARGGACRGSARSVVLGMVAILC